MNIGFGFILKKAISALLMPLSLSIFLLIVSLWYLSKNKTVKAKKYLISAILWIVIISYAPFSYLLLLPLEQSYSKIKDIPQNVGYILLLGGDRKARTWEALRIYNNIPNVKIITSGYSRRGVLSGAEKTALLLIDSGVNKEDILTQNKVKDTHEEAQFVKSRVGNKAFILVTSAYHMPRSMKLFQQMGLKPIAAPTDYSDKNDIDYYRVSGEALKETEKAWHEYMGLLWIKVKSII